MFRNQSVSNVFYGNLIPKKGRKLTRALDNSHSMSNYQTCPTPPYVAMSYA